jgi:methyltransferase (TIGR00027 family)
MEEAQPSSTALGAAMFRAAHQLLDDPPKIFDDTFALRLCGCENETALRVQLDQVAAEIARRASIDFAQIALRHLRASVIVRSRYVEDELDRAIKRGVSQYVILGAGLDSFAYRRSDVAKVLRVLKSIIPRRKSGSGHAYRTWALRRQTISHSSQSILRNSR